MAKDRRNKVRPRMDLEGIQGDASSKDAYDLSSVRRRPSPSAEQPAQTAEESKKKRSRSKKKLSRAALVIRCVVAVLVLAVVIFLCVLGNYIYQAVFVDDRVKYDSIAPTTFDVTPTADKNKVSYYLLGILGESDSSDMSMASVICHDKQAGSVSVMQIPVQTYINKGDAYVVDTVGSIWANPKPFDWCETCRKRVYAPEINEGDVATHTVCNTEITYKTGSSVASLVDFVNDQLSLPVDSYFVIPRKGLRTLIDAVGGVDVTLGDDITLADTDYTAGPHTLSGAAATEYMTYTDGSFDRERIRMERQREVLGAVLTRMLRLEKNALKEDVIEEVMDSAGAIRTECSVDEMVEIVSSMSAAGTAKTTMYVLPGELTYDADGDEVYSVHTAELVNLLTTAFNPYGQPISESDLTVPELVNTGAADVKQQALSACVADQTGKLLESSDEE